MNSLIEHFMAGFEEDEIDDYASDIELVHKSTLSEHRWYDRVFEVYRRGNELAGVKYDKPSTEMQEGQDLNASAFEVEAFEETVTNYRPLASTEKQDQEIEN